MTNVNPLDGIEYGLRLVVYLLAVFILGGITASLAVFATCLSASPDCPASHFGRHRFNSNMSDFDKEAEREKLREKYERDQQKREATEQMSELLLQGATMTNAHCSDCGDPVFRYDGQEFCPTCEKAVDREGGGEGDEQAGIEVTDTSDTRVAFGGDSERDQQRRAKSSDPAPDQQTDQQRTPDPQRAQGRSESAPRDTAQHAQGRSDSQPRDQPRDRTPAQQSQADVGGVPAARDALVDTLVRFSQRAAASDDPRRARDNLEAAREAAEALSALDR